MKRAAIVVLLSLVVLTACGGGTKTTTAQSTPPPGTASPTESGMTGTCTPKGAMTSGPSIVAKGTKYLETCLGVPAGQKLTIKFVNQDSGIMHNVHIFTADPMMNPNAKSIFVGKLVTGPAESTYHVPALTAGSYHFHCDVHPTQMFGTLVVEK